MSEIDLASKFPDMKPIQSPPALSTLNGVGLTVYGARDFDEETGTYVKTHCFCVLFIPLLTLGAYRVADAPGGGWYFIGRVPLSALARVWNILIVCGVLCTAGLIAWNTYTGTADYIDGQKLAEADRLAADGQVASAAQLYRKVAEGGTQHARKAMTGLKDLLDGPVAKASATDAAVVLAIAVKLKARPGAVADLFERGRKLADAHARTDPRGALAVIDAVASVAPAAALAEARRPLLEKVVKKEPDNLEPAIRLAVIYEAQGQKPKCEALLARHARRLGSTECARILGQIYASQGKLDQAHALLVPYAEERLAKLHDAEKNYSKTQEKVWKEEWARIRQHVPPDYPTQRLQRAANEDEKQAILTEYLHGRTKDSPEIKAAQEKWQQEASVAPVALDLGMVLLRRAQGLADPAARRRELEKAEKVFLAIRGTSGESSLRLGQVYYWLGKAAEGHKLFERLLAARGRDPDSLLMVGYLLREVGAVSEARALAEEAYTKQKGPRKKQEAAGFRSLMFTDLDDEIKWLGRSNTSQSGYKASLETALGQKSLRDGDEEGAARHLRNAGDIWASQPESAATLNNGAIVNFALYQVTGESAAYDKGAAMIEKAAARKAGDSILLGNSAGTRATVASRSIIGKTIDLKVLRNEGNLALLSYLYRDQKGKDRFVAQVRKHPDIARAVASFEKLLVLAPKNVSGYASLAYLYELTHDLERLRTLARRLEEAELDPGDASRKALDHYRGKDDAKNRKDFIASVKRSKKLLAAAEKVGGPTLAVAATTLAGALTSLEIIDSTVNVDDIVALAEKAHAAAPSAATHNNLVASLLLRASRSLARKEKDYADVEARGRRSVGAPSLLALALGSEGKLRQAALADKDVQRVITLLVEGRKQFPADYSPWEWAMLRAAHPDEAAQIARGILKDEAGRLQRAINLKLQPVSGSTALNAYWALRIAGQEAEGLKLLKRYRDRGVPLPEVPK